MSQWIIFLPISVSSVAQSCLTLCDPMNCSMPGLPIHHQLPDFTQTHIHRVSDAIQPSHPLSSPSPPAPDHSQHQSLFQWVSSSHEVAFLPKWRQKKHLLASSTGILKNALYKSIAVKNLLPIEGDTSNALRDNNVFYCCYYNVVYYSEVLNKLYLQYLDFLTSIIGVFYQTLLK